MNAARISMEEHEGPVVSLQTKGNQHILTFHSGVSEVEINCGPWTEISTLSFEGSEIQKTATGAKAKVRTIWVPGRGGWDGILLTPDFVSIRVKQVDPNRDCVFYRNDSKVHTGKDYTYIAGVPAPPSGKVEDIAPAEKPK